MATLHFDIRTDRPNKEGAAPIFLVFTINRYQRIRISIGKHIQLKKEYRKLNNEAILNTNSTERLTYYCWDSTKERAIKGCDNWESINSFLDKEKFRANEILLKFQLQNKPITCDLFRNAFCKPAGTDKFYDYFLSELEKRKKLIAYDTYRGYKVIINKVNEFKPNLVISDIDFKFLSRFENYLLTPVKEGGCANNANTVSKNLKMLRALIQIAIKNGDLQKEQYPFKDFRIKHIDPVLTTRDYLEPDDLLKVEQLLSPEKISELSPGEIKATKRFLFACYTGLRFSDVIALKRSEHIYGKYVLEPKTNNMVYRYYIELNMTKTSKPVFIPLIDKAMELINENKGEFVFDNITNQKINKHLKSINKKAKLNKKLTFHVARHSFATICFLYGIPEKVGQKLLGHKNRKFTEVYTHLSQNRLFYEMDKLNRGLSSYEVMVDEAEGKDKMKEILPMLQNLSKEKLSSLIKLLG